MHIDLLTMTTHGKNVDLKKNAKYFSENELKEYEVSIDTEGRFKWKKDDSLLETQDMVSHEKQGYAAYVMTEDQRIFVFQHLHGRNNVYHSSMSGGKPVIAAGEIVVQEGMLSIINTHSGHYAPTILSIEHALQIFDEKKLNFSNARIETMDNVSAYVTGLKTNRGSITVNGFKTQRYYTSAQQTFNTLKSKMEEFDGSVEKNEFNRAIKAFNVQEQAKLTRWFSMLDAILHKISKKPSLTEARKRMRKNALLALQNMDEAKVGLDEKIKQVDAFIKQNSELSEKHGKRKDSGRLHKSLNQYKRALEALKRPLSVRSKRLKGAQLEDYNFIKNIK